MARLPKEKKEFRLKFNFMLLTYKRWLNKENLSKFINKQYLVKQIEIAHEAPSKDCDDFAKATPYKHTHVVVSFKKQVCLTNERKFDYLRKTENNEEIIHPNMKVLVGRKAFEDGLGYISKEDPQCAHLAKYKNRNIVERIWASDNIQDALLENVNDTKDAIGVISIFEHKGLPERKTRIIKLLFNWHFDLYKEIIDQKNIRKVVWYYDKIGNTGKSEFLRWMVQEHNNETVFFKRFGGASNMSHRILENHKAGKDIKYVIFDPPRHYSEIENIYECLEDLVDGLHNSTKYIGGELLLDTPIILVFANFLPDVTTMSKDRWDIREITNVNEPVKQLNYSTVLKEVKEVKSVKAIPYWELNK